MIALLNGKLARKNGDEIIVDVSGVGYLVTVTGQVLGTLGDINGAVSIIIYTDVRENAILLYGFASQLEREVFLLLKKVKGIGSKVSMAIISGIGAERVLSSIGQSDVTALTKVSGVGKKTAERVIVELREKVGEYVVESSLSISSQVEVITSQKKALFRNASESVIDALLALEKLGFTEQRAKEALETVLASGKNSNDAGELVRSALAHL